MTTCTDLILSMTLQRRMPTSRSLVKFVRPPLATTDESRGLEVQNQLLDDMKAEFQELDVEFTLMWSVKEFHHQMPISNQWRPEEFKRRRTGTQHWYLRYHK